MFPALQLKCQGNMTLRSVTFFLLILCVSRALGDDSRTESQTRREESYRQDISSFFTSNTNGNGENPYKNRCGKPYKPSASAFTIQGQFPSPQISTGRRLEFGCTPAIQPYISTDNESTIYMVVDAVLTQYQTNRSIELSPETPELQVVVINTNTSKAVASGMVKVNTLGNQMKFSFKDLGEPSMKPYNLICQAYVNEQWITETSTSVKYLPSNLQKGIASVVRMNAESGTLMVTDDGGEMMPFIPFGFFATYENYLDSPDLSQIIRDMQSRGINTVQPVVRKPSVTDLGKLASVLSKFSRAGMWVQYDMTRSFKNTKQLEKQLKTIKSHGNLLVYHTANEPDGTDESIDALFQSSEFIESMDPYRPVSLTLTCADYRFTDYSRDTDIVMTDPYMIGLKSASVSTKFGTVCNSTYGDCGCDNCRGQYLDLLYRLRVFRERRHYLGKDRTMQLWAVPQAFGEHDHWSRSPTGDEFLLMCTIYLIDGAVGLMGWREDAKTTANLKKGAAKLGNALPKIMPFLGLPQAFFPIPPSTPYPNDTFVARVWPNPKNNTMLVLVANLIEQPVNWNIKPPKSSFLPQGKNITTETLYLSEGEASANVTVSGESISLTGTIQGLGCGAWIIPM